MKELWSYLSRLFVGSEGKPLKRIRKAADSPAYEAAVDQMFSSPCGRRRSGGRAHPSDWERRLPSRPDTPHIIMKNGRQFCWRPFLFAERGKTLPVFPKMRTGPSV